MADRCQVTISSNDLASLVLLLRIVGSWSNWRNYHAVTVRYFSNLLAQSPWPLAFINYAGSVLVHYVTQYVGDGGDAEEEQDEGPCMH